MPDISPAEDAVPTRHPHRRIDQARWNRAALFRLFQGFAQPQYSVTVRLDVTRLMRDFVPEGTSPNRACLYAFGAAVAAVDAFRLRFDGDDAIVYDTVDVSTTLPTQDGTFWFTAFPFEEDWPAFDRIAADALAPPPPHTGSLTGGERRDLTYCSCLPWVDLQGLTHTWADVRDDIPRITWGRIVSATGGSTVGCAIGVHHALVDGEHIGSLVEHIQHTLDTVDFTPAEPRPR